MDIRQFEGRDFIKEFEISKNEEQKQWQIFDKVVKEINDNNKFKLFSSQVEPSRKLYMARRNYIIAENDVHWSFLHSIKFYHNLLGGISKTDDLDSQLIDGVLLNLENGFNNYYSICSQMKSLENDYKIAYNEFVNYKSFGVSETDAVLEIYKKYKNYDALHLEHRETLFALRRRLCGDFTIATMLADSCGVDMSKYQDEMLACMLEMGEE